MATGWRRSQRRTPPRGAAKKWLSRAGGFGHAVGEICVKNDSSQTGAASRPRAAGKMLGEAVLVAAFGAAFAFAANQLSPRGLALTRDYFPAGTAPAVRPVAGEASPPAAGANSGAPAPAQWLATQMKERGLQLLDGPQAVKLFHDPRFRRGAIVFIDARDGEHYQQGHIPGAYEFDPYHPEKYFDPILPVCQKAEQIVVYCNGGDCDDSETAALLLRDVGIPNQKLFVYGGGITEWRTNNLPLETGMRNRGNRQNLNK